MNLQPTISSSKKVTHLPALPHKTCSHCGSVFITDSECESCGRQFNKELLGAPGGEKSFYALRERYRKDVGSFLARFDSFIAKDASYRTRYLSQLKKRYLVLLDYFQQPGRHAISAHAYFVEFRDLVVEMRKMGISLEYMYDMASLDESAPLTHKLISILNEECSESGAIKQLTNFRIAGGPRVVFLMLTIFAYGGLSAAAIWFYSYLASR